MIERKGEAAPDRVCISCLGLTDAGTWSANDYVCDDCAEMLSVIIDGWRSVERGLTQIDTAKELGSFAEFVDPED
jgi:hypothetical protein